MWTGTCRKILFFILFRPPTLFLRNKIRKTKNKISVALVLMYFILCIHGLIVKHLLNNLCWWFSFLVVVCFIVSFVIYEQCCLLSEIKLWFIYEILWFYCTVADCFKELLWWHIVRHELFIFKYLSETAQQILTKFLYNRRQVLKFLFQVFVFRPNLQQRWLPWPLADTFFSSPLQWLHGFQWNLTGSNYSILLQVCVFLVDP